MIITANCYQTSLHRLEALAFGKTKEEVETEFVKAGKSLEEVKDIVPFKVFTGNKPTNSILVQKLHHLFLVH